MGFGTRHGGDPSQREHPRLCYGAQMYWRSRAMVIGVAAAFLCSCGGGTTGDDGGGGSIPPSGLTYSVNPAFYTAGAAISPNIPSSSGGAVVSYSVSPALPAGLSLNASTGAISGTPSSVTATATYTVTATNPAGSTTVGLSITVSATTVPPSGLTYAVNPATYTVAVPISPNTPSSSGGPVASYSVSPDLPAGLTLNTTSGAISGTPTAVIAAAAYSVIATNAAGSTTASLIITVNAAVAPPSGLTYPVNPAVYTVGVEISPNTPSSSGGPVASYSVSPDLPAGLTLNTTSGAISGMPTAVIATAAYTVIATNAAGSTTASLTITVNAAEVPPTGLVYSVNPAFYTAGAAILPNIPSSSGGAVVSYSVSPALPAGLSLNASTGAISGTPSSVTATATYTVTATNPAGSTTVGLSITVGPSGMAARFISASPVVAGHGSVSISLPPAWRAGDVLVTMLFTPTGAPSLPAGWRHAQTYNYFKVAGSSESAVTVTTNRGLVAGTIAAYRGVDTRAGYLPGGFGSSAFPEYGGATAAPGTYYPPDGSQTPKFTSGVCGFSLGPALTEGSIAVATYQSESTDSFPLSPHYAGAGVLTERSLDYASMVNPDTGNIDHFRLGFYDAPLAAGVGTGNLYFGTMGNGGGERADTLQPYAGPVAWFSQLILSGSPDRGPDLTIMPPGAPVGGAVTVIGSRASDATVQVSCSTASVSAVTYPKLTTWQANVSGLAPGPNTITASSGIETTSITVQQ